MRQEIAIEFEAVKDLSSAITILKNEPPSHKREDPLSNYEEPTRDPDVWPPPTPVETKLVMFDI